MTMVMSHLTDDDLVLHYYGEVEADGRLDAQRHLDACGDCRHRYLTLQRVLAAVDAVPSPALPDGFERVVWARLEPVLPKRRGSFSWLLSTPSNLAWVAAVLLLIAGAFFAGRMSRMSTQSPALVTAEQVREGVLLADLSEHLDRSQRMLVELVTEDPAGADAIDVSLERDVAEDLVAANRLYRQAVSETGDSTIEEFLDDLEQLLVELATSPGQMAPEDMQRVRQRITAKDLLFKVRVMSSAVKEKQDQRIRARAGQSS
jgi:hypothetical protein